MPPPRSKAPLGVPFLLAVAVAFTTAVRGTARADGPVASDPVFKAVLTDGSTVSGRIRQFGPTGDVTLVTDGAAERVVPAASLVKLSREGFQVSLAPEAMVVLFPEGDRLVHTSIGAAGETTVDIQPDSLDHLTVPLDSILGMVFSLPPDPEAANTVLQRVRDEPRTTELLWLANNDRLNVGFLALTDRTVDFLVNKKPDKLDRARVVALGFDPALVSYPAPKGNFFDLTLKDGSRLGATGLAFEQGQVRATTRFGAAIKVPLAELLRVHARTPSVVYLSERKPARERYVAYVGPSRPYRVNANVEGQSLKLAGQEFDRGIGTSSRTLLAYLIEPGDQRFQATVGVDDRAGPLGNVAFRVLVDNNERFASPAMSAGDTPRDVDVDLKGGRVLVLVTEFGERGSVRDLADWVEARVIRQAEQVRP